MKNFILLFVASLYVITSCDNSTNDDNLKTITGISITGGVETLAIGDSCTLTAIITPDNILNEIQGNAGWEISDKSVIQIKSLPVIEPTSIKIIGLKEGTTTISFYAFMIGQEKDKKEESITIQIVSQLP